MKNIIQALISFEDGYYIVNCANAPIVTQGKTLDEATKNLREAVDLFLEDSKDSQSMGFSDQASVMVNYELVKEYA